MSRQKRVRFVSKRVRIELQHRMVQRMARKGWRLVSSSPISLTRITVLTFVNQHDPTFAVLRNPGDVIEGPIVQIVSCDCPIDHSEATCAGDD